LQSIQDKKEKLNRRKFLIAGLGASIVALFGQAGAALFNFFKPRFKPGSFGGLIAAGQVEEFELGTVSHIRAARCYLTRLEDGGFIALWQRCTHLGCTVPWRQDENRFNCPCHSSIFDAVGEVESGPAPRPLDLFAIAIEDDQVVIDTGDPIRRDAFEPSQVTYS
jgi:cytochrome b6-f complex iron-sulfur subunit